jgi:hypothetical protein
MKNQWENTRAEAALLHSCSGVDTSETNNWEFVLTGARRPIVGRVYARMKLSGVKPSAANVVTETWSLDLANVS